MRSKHNATTIAARAGMIMALAAGSILLSQVSIAEPEDKEERRAQHRQHMQEQFGVTDDQFAQMHEIRSNGGSREDMKAVLSDDQRQQMRQWREQNPREGGRHGKQGKGQKGQYKGSGSQDKS